MRLPNVEGTVAGHDNSAKNIRKNAKRCMSLHLAYSLVHVGIRW